MLRGYSTPGASLRFGLRRWLPVELAQPAARSRAAGGRRLPQPAGIGAAGVSEVGNCLSDGLEYLRSNRDSFDGIFCTDVLEHIPGTANCIEWVQAAHNALRPGGFFVCRCPNAANLTAGFSRYIDLTHERSFTDVSMLQLLEAGDLQGLPHFADPIRSMDRQRAAMDRLQSASSCVPYLRSKQRASSSYQRLRGGLPRLRAVNAKSVMNCLQCPMQAGSKCRAAEVAEAELRRTLPPPPLGSCMLPIVGGYLTLIQPGMRVLDIGCGSWARIRNHCEKVGAVYEGIDVAE